MPGFSCSYKCMDVAKSVKGVACRLDSIALSYISRLTDFRATLRSYDEAQKSHGKQIHGLMEYNFLEYFHLCLADLSTPKNSRLMSKTWIFGKKAGVKKNENQRIKNIVFASVLFSSSDECSQFSAIVTTETKRI